MLVLCNLCDVCAADVGDECWMCAADVGDGAG